MRESLLKTGSRRLLVCFQLVHLRLIPLLCYLESIQGMIIEMRIGLQVQRNFNMLQSYRSVFEFEMVKKINEGTYGTIYKAKDKKTGEIVALKKAIVDLPFDGVDDFREGEEEGSEVDEEARFAGAGGTHDDDHLLFEAMEGGGGGVHAVAARPGGGRRVHEEGREGVKREEGKREREERGREEERGRKGEGERDNMIGIKM